MLQFQGLTIVVPKEIMPGEKRVAVIPETVREFVREGARIRIEAGAGEQAFIEDHMYQAEGAEVVADLLELYGQADIVIKVKEPWFNEKIGKHEAELFPTNCVIICFFNPLHTINHFTVKTLAKRGITSFSLDGIPRIPKAQPMDALTSMSSIAGYKAMIIAAYHLCRLVPSIPSSFGTIQPASVLVIGTGVAGLQAVATARRLGASVTSLDIREEANEQAQSLGAEIIPFDVPPELAVGEGGYTRLSPKEWYEKERSIIETYVVEADVIILTVMVMGEEPPLLITEDMVNKMRKGSVIVDVVAGNCDLTRPGKEFYHNGIFISGLTNIPGTVPIDSSIQYAYNIWHFLRHIVVDGKVDSFRRGDPIIKGTLVTGAGKIIDQRVLKAIQLEGNA